MSFKHFLSEDISIKAPKPYKVTFDINFKEYRELIKLSSLNNKKILLKRLDEEKGEIPVFCEELKRFFFMEIDGKRFRTRELKSREDKELCGALLNSLFIYEFKKENTTKLKELTEMKLNWEAPLMVYKIKDEFGKNISIKDII